MGGKADVKTSLEAGWLAFKGPLWTELVLHRVGQWLETHFEIITAGLASPLDGFVKAGLVEAGPENW